MFRPSFLLAPMLVSKASAKPRHQRCVAALQTFPAQVATSGAALVMCQREHRLT